MPPHRKAKVLSLDHHQPFGSHVKFSKRKRRKRLMSPKDLFENMEPRILLIGEVSELLRVSTSTVRRWTSESRKGAGHFPLPISTKGGKGRWLRTSIEAFIESQQSMPVPTSTRQRRDEKSRQERQVAVDRALERFRR